MANYNLKSTKEDKEQLLYLRASLNGKAFKYSLGKSFKVKPIEWDSEKQNFTSKVKDWKSKNKFLRFFMGKFHTLEIEIYNSKGHLCHKSLREELDKILDKSRSKQEEKSALGFEEYWSLWERELSIIRSKATVKKKKYALNAFKKFSKNRKRKLCYDNVNQEFANSFKEWAFKLRNKNGEEVYSTDNTINKYLSILKEFMKWSCDKGYSQSQDYKKISNLNESYFNVYALSAKEIRKLISIDFNDSKIKELDYVSQNIDSLELARDSFVFRCLCGIRFSDFQNLSVSSIKDSQLNLTTIKTSTRINFKLHLEAQKILEKYDYKIPALTNTIENELLKVVGRIAEFDELVKCVRKRKGQKIHEEKKKWEILTTHVARKSFITNCLNAGMQQHVVMKLAGISKPTTLQRYISVTDNDIAREFEKLNGYI